MAGERSYHEVGTLQESGAVTLAIRKCDGLEFERSFSAHKNTAIISAGEIPSFAEAASDLIRNRGDSVMPLLRALSQKYATQRNNHSC